MGETIVVELTGDRINQPALTLARASAEYLARTGKLITHIETSEKVADILLKAGVRLVREYQITSTTWRWKVPPLWPLP